MSINFKSTEDDWKTKLAGDIRPGRPEIERAFAEQAYSFIKAKAGGLMEDQWCLGFELIHSNDDNSRIIGAFVFRVGPTLWLAPVFFLNGQIKGDQFLWNSKKKLLVPLCNEWAEHIIRTSSSQLTQEGQLVDRAEVERHSGLGYDLNTIARQPHRLTKSASQALGLPGLGNSTEQQIVDIFGPVATENGPLTRQMLKVASDDFVDRLLATMEGSDKFAETMLQFTDGDLEPFKDAAIRATQVKVASEPPPALTFRIGMLPKVAADTKANMPANKAMWNHGFEVEDPRLPVDTVKMVQTDLQFASLEIGTVADIPVIGEEATARALVMRSIDLRPLNLSNGYYTDGPYPCGDKEQHLHLYFVDTNTTSRVLPQEVNGISLTDEDPTSRDVIEKIMKEPSVGETYYITTTAGKTITARPYYVVEMDKRKSGFVNLVVAPIYQYGLTGEHIAILMDESKSTDFKNGILGGDVAFLPCALEEKKQSNSPKYPYESESLIGNKKPAESPVPMPARSLFEIITKNNGLVVNANKSDRDKNYRLKIAYHNHEDENYVFDHPVKLAAALCLRVGLSGNDAMEVINELDENYRTKFATIAPVEMTKVALNNPSASLMRGYTQREPNWQPHFDSYNNVLTDFPREFQTSVSQQQSGRPSMEPNEMMQLMINQGSANAPAQEQNPQILPFDELMNMKPTDIETAMKDRNLMFATEHGVIGQLINTYDSGRVIAELIPDIEIGLDRLGRILFLLYWKPTDFERIYGSDELLQRETQLSGTFRSLGLLVLDLKKKPLDAAGSSQAL